MANPIYQSNECLKKMIAAAVQADNETFRLWHDRWQLDTDMDDEGDQPLREALVLLMELYPEACAVR